MRRVESAPLTILLLTLATLVYSGCATAQEPPPQPTFTVTSSDPYATLDGPDLLQARKLERLRLQKWERRLAQIAAKEHAPLFYDVRDFGDPPTADYVGKLGTDSMKALALAGSREWKQIHGIQAFSRAGVSLLRDDVNSLIEWMASLAEPDFRSIVAGHTILADLAPDVRKQFDGIVAANSDMAFVFLDNDDISQICVKPSLIMSYVDAKSGATRTVDFAPDVHTRSPNEKPEPSAARSTTHKVPKHLDEPPKGELDFGKGEVLTLHEIAARASKVFGVSYDVDGRIARANFFVSGSYDRTAFDATLEYVTLVPPARPRKPAKDTSGDIARVKDLYHRFGPKNIDLAGLRYEMGFSNSADIDALSVKYGASEPLDLSGFYTKQSMPASDLAGSMPGFAHYLQTIGVSPATVLSLDFTLTLVISCPGIHTSSAFSYTDPDQPPIQGVAGNQATMELWAP